jgi:hypothetical protein
VELALQTDQPALTEWLDRELTAQEASTVGRAFGVLLEPNRRLGKRVEELEHHLDLLARDRREQMSVARAVEDALVRISQFTRLPVDPEF